MMRDWINTAALQEFEIDKDHTILDDLTVSNYYYNTQDALLIEPKEEIKRREKFSPDIADALACTFAFPALLDMPAFEREDSNYTSGKDHNPYARIPA